MKSKDEQQRRTTKTNDVKGRKIETNIGGEKWRRTTKAMMGASRQWLCLFV